jgi:signal transduction histidine kinase
LVARTQEAGVWAQLRVEGESRELAPAVDLSAYRIVQEALTNVIRHAHATRVDVTLIYLPRELRVSVVDDGVGGAGAGGHGLVGMRERVALFGGTLETGIGCASEGYQVLASIPTE